MSAAALLDEFEGAGVRLIPTGTDGLRVDAPRGVITPEVRDSLQRHKAEIIALLQPEREVAGEVDEIELLHLFHERAAIMEIDGGLLREDAMWLAAREVLDTPDKLRAYAEHHPATQALLRRGCEIVDVRFSNLGKTNSTMARGFARYQKSGSAK